MASQNINIAFKHNSTNNNGTGATAMSYSPSSHTMPAIFQHRDSFVHQRELESNFCSDLICCGAHIKDLHELLHHYEEHHHAPIVEEPAEPKQNNPSPLPPPPQPMEDIETFPIPLTTAHETVSVAPLLRSFGSFRDEEEPSNKTTTSAGSMSPSRNKKVVVSHTEEILKQALPNLMNSDSSGEHGPDLRFFSSEVLYQTCDDGQDKPYKCQIAGCDKAYKNANGLKYHRMHGHSEEDELKDAQKPYVCTIGYCNKRYKNLNGLKYHIEHSHIAKLKQQSLDIQPWQAFSNH
ncbi:hypothetical protein G6F62_008998 [Rhizopus arrhizus]|nr:hypothetical protein G6F62_008998 [Rhizopus arrhizus]